MLLNGNLTLVGLIEGLALEGFASNPATEGLKPNSVWVDTATGAVKWFDGTAIKSIVNGEDIEDFLDKTGDTMTGPLVLSGPATEDLHPATFLQVTEGLSTKQATVTGAASTILDSDLATDRAMVTDVNGKVGASAVTATELGYLQGVSSSVQTQLNNKQADLGYTPVNTAGDTMSGDLSFDGTAKVTNLGAPVNPTDAIRLIDIDNLKADLDFQEDVLAIQEDDTLDPTATPTEGDRYIITDITTMHVNFGTITGVADNDIVEYDGTEFVVVYDVSDAGPGVLAWDRAGSHFVKFNGTIWTEHGGLSGVTASAGLQKEGNTISVKFGSGVKVGSSGGVSLDLAVSRGLDLLDPTTFLPSTAADAKLSVVATGALELSESGLRVKAAGIDETMLATSALGNGLEGGAGNAITLTLADTSLVVDGSGVKVGDLSAAYVSRTGDSSINGQVSVPAPTAETSIANRLYVDDAIGSTGEDLVALKARFEGSQVVVDGTVGSAQTVYSVNHAMGNRFVSVKVYSETYEELIPNSVVMTDADNVTVTLTEAQKVYVVVQGLKAEAA